MSLTATIVAGTASVLGVTSPTSDGLRSPLAAAAVAVAVGLGPAGALGVGRFAYALVLPDMLAALDIGVGRAGLLASANTAGYLLGALVSHKVLAALGYRRGFYLAGVVQALTLLALALAPPFWLMALLRLAQGVLGAAVFVGGAALVMASGGRALGLGLYFGSIGFGIFVSPLVLPLAGDWRAAWLWLGVMGLALTAAASTAWPRLVEPAPPPPAGGGGGMRQIRAALLSYGLYGAGYIVYMTFVTADLRGPVTPFWLVLGLGAMANGPVWGPVTARLGGTWAQVAVLAALTTASLQPLVHAAPYFSAALFGVSFLGVITAITDLIRERLPPGAWPRAMALSTAAFAVGQAVGPGAVGFVGEALGPRYGGELRVIMYLGTALLAAAVLVALLAPRRGARVASGPA